MGCKDAVISRAAAYACMQNNKQKLRSTCMAWQTVMSFGTADVRAAKHQALTTTHWAQPVQCCLSCVRADLE